MKHFGERLKSLRKTAGITQQELADKLNVHLQTVSKWERGISEPDFSLLGDIAAALGVTFERLLGTDEGECTYDGSFSPEDSGRALASARKAKGESQDEIAAAVGVSPDIVSKWERGIICPDMEQLCALAVHFEVPVSKLYFGIAQDAVTQTHMQAMRRRRVSLATIIVAAFVAVAIVLSIVLPQVLTRRFIVTVNGVEYEVSSDDWFTPATPQKPGYDFAYFTDSAGEIVNFPIKITSDTHYTAVYSVHEYAIDYWLNGGTFQSDAAYTFSVESGTVELATPVKNGATFEGWYLTPDYLGEAVERIECNAVDIDLYAKWSDEVFTIRYELCGGSLSEANPVSVTAAQEVALSEPVRKGYNFLGWYDAPEGGSLYESVGGANASNLTLYARWQESSSYFSITYHTDGGEMLGENPQAVGAGEVHDLFGASKNFYDFVGWNTSADGSGEWVKRLYGVREDVHLYAIYTPKVYTVIYDLDGGAYEESESVNPNRITYGEVVTLSPLFKAGHTFAGWFTEKEGGIPITEIDPGNVAQLTTIYARFTVDQYTVTLDAAGGEFVLGGDLYNCLAYEMYFGEELVLPECVLAGYDFIGWYDERGERVEVIDVENVGNLTLTAKYREAGLTYRIDYVLGGGTLKEANPDEVAWGQVIELKEPLREGWLFLGWNTAADGSGEYLQATPEGREEDITLYAIWQEIMVSGSAANFKYKIGSESVIITGYTGPFGENVDLVIPSYIEGKPVVAIDGKFDRYTQAHPETFYLNSLVIPGTVERLGDNCFNYMDISQPVVIPASVTEIGRECFRATMFSLAFEEGSSLKSIGERAFAGAYIENILVLPEGLERLESYAFNDALVYACGIVLPETLKFIGGSALNVRSENSIAHPCLYIPSSVEQIEPYAFGRASIRIRIYTALREEQTSHFIAGWDSNAQVYYLEKEVEGITLKDGDDQIYLEGQHFALPSREKEGYTFIGWRDAQGNFVNNNYIPLQDGIVLEAVYEPDSQSDGRSEYTPFVLENGVTYEVIVFGDQPFYVKPDVDTGDRFRITFSMQGSNCFDNHEVWLINDEYDDYVYQGVTYVYEGNAMYFNTLGCKNGIFVMTVCMEVM